jgi:3-oxoacyl-[acyl-carrier-protein] synthase III
VIWDEIFIESVEAYLPERVPLGDVESGMSAGDSYSGFETVTKADKPMHIMAGLAAKEALEKSVHVDENLLAIIYVNVATTWEQHITPAIHLQRILRQPEALAFQLSSASNGGMAGVEVLARLLSASPGFNAGLLSAVARTLDETGRWMGGTVHGDGAVAVVLSRTGGFARLVASQTISSPEFEVLYNNIGGSAHRNLRLLNYSDTIVQEISSIISVTLAEADITMEHISHVTLPAFPLVAMHTAFLDCNSIPLAKTCWPELRKNGHIGPCDQLLSLAYLRDTYQLQPGQFVLMIGVGLGYQFTCMLLEIIQPSQHVNT